MSKAESQIEVIARGAWIDGGKVLLCLNEKGGFYYLPGGHVEFGESAARALAREFEEETGIQVRVAGCVLVTEGFFESGRKPHHELNLLFHVKHSPTAVASREAGISFQWIDLAGLVDLDVRPQAIKAWLVSGGVSDGSVGWFSDFGQQS